MTFTQEQLDEHGIWSSIDRTGALLDAMDTGGNAAVLGRVGDTRQILGALKELKDLPGWRFVGVPGGPEDPLARVSENLNVLADYVASLSDEADRDWSAVAERLGGLLDHVVAEFNAIPSPVIKTGHVSGIRAATTEYEKDVQRALTRLGTGSDALTRRLADLEQQAESDRREADEGLADLQSQIASAKEEATAQVSRLDTAITTQSTTFTTKLSEWQAAHDASMKSADTTLEDRLVEFDTESVEALREQQERAESSIAVMTELEAQAKALVHGTSRWAVSTKYAQYARAEEFKATSWSIGATIVALAGIVGMITTLSHISGVTTSEAIFKSTLSVGVLAVAGFMGKVGQGHHNEARDAKRVQLDLNALEPFIANLDAEAQDGLRKATALRVFNRPLANPRHGAPDAFGFQVKSEMDSLLESIKIGGKKTGTQSEG